MLFLKLVTPTPPTELKYIGNIFYKYVSFVEYINMRGCKFCCQNINKLKPTPYYFLGKKFLNPLELTRTLCQCQLLNCFGINTLIWK